MEKRYQVFVSSTFLDLQDARREVMQALLELDCIPSGMELFPAADDDQWSLIKKVIDDSDYYIAILAGRYGSIGPDGYSYTEMEYRYATKIGKPVIGFVHKNPGILPSNACEVSDEGKEKLEEFRALTQKKMCRLWDNPSDLGSQVSRSLIKLIKNKPAVGWVRANLVPTESSAKEILSLRRRIEELEQEIQSARVREPEGTTDLQKGNDTFEIRYTYHDVSFDPYSSKEVEGTASFTWNEIFSAISPLMINESSETALIRALNSMLEARWLEKLKGATSGNDDISRRFTISRDDYHTIKIQLRALGLIVQSNKNRSIKDTSTYWALTPYGDTTMTMLRARRKYDDLV